MTTTGIRLVGLIRMSCTNENESCSETRSDSVVRRLLSALHWNSSNSVLRTRGRLALLLLLSDSSASSILRTSTSTSTSFPSVASRKSLRHVIASLPSSGCCSTSLPNPEVSCWPLSTRNVAPSAPRQPPYLPSLTGSTTLFLAHLHTMSWTPDMRSMPCVSGVEHALSTVKLVL